MKAINLKTAVGQHSILVPDAIEDKTHLHMLLLIDDHPINAARDDLKRRLAKLTEGLGVPTLLRHRTASWQRAALII